MQKLNAYTFDKAMTEEAFLSLLEYFNHPAWVRCVKGKYLWVNDSFLKLFNVKREDVINKVNADFIPPEILRTSAASEQEVLEKRCPLTFYLEGKEYRRIVYKTPIFSNDSEIIAIAGLMLDLAQERELETQLNSLKDFYHSLLSNMGEALLFINKDGNFDLINKRAKDMLAEYGFYGPYNHQSWINFFPKRYEKNGKRFPKNKGIFNKAMEGKTILDEEVHFLDPRNGQKKAFRASAIPFKNKEDNSTAGVILTVSDITQEKLLIDALAKKTKLVEQRNQELHQFAYSAAHDLRDPLRNISLSASLIYEKVKSNNYEGIEELLERLLKTASYGSSLVKNLLDYSAANREMEMEPTCLGEVVNQTIAVLNDLIEQSDARITFTTLPVVLGNPQQLQIVFQNIISNAINHKGNNPLIVSISAHRKKSLWVISIKDNGPGIKEEFRDEIFLPFKRLSANNAGGRSSGLGLSICRRIIEQHGGEIWLAPQSPPGACFKFTLKSID